MKVLTVMKFEQFLSEETFIIMVKIQQDAMKSSFRYDEKLFPTVSQCKFQMP